MLSSVLYCLYLFVLESLLSCISSWSTVDYIELEVHNITAKTIIFQYNFWFYFRCAPENRHWAILMLYMRYTIKSGLTHTFYNQLFNKQKPSKIAQHSAIFVILVTKEIVLLGYQILKMAECCAIFEDFCLLNSSL